MMKRTHKKVPPLKIHPQVDFIKKALDKQLNDQIYDFENKITA